jgi:hypothetical protein
MKEASINAKQAGERGISAKNVKKVTEVSSGYLDMPFAKQSIDVIVEIQRLNDSWNSGGLTIRGIG